MTSATNCPTCGGKWPDIEDCKDGMPHSFESIPHFEGHRCLHCGLVKECAYAHGWVLDIRRGNVVGQICRYCGETCD